MVEVVVTAVVGLVVAAPTAWLTARAASKVVGYRREVGRQDAVDERARRAEERSRREAADQAAAAASAAAAHAVALDERRAALHRDRVGTMFLERRSRQDPGAILTVTDLHPTQWETHVTVSMLPLETPATNDWIGRFSTSWSRLNEADNIQRHRTARLIEQSHDDADGWVEVAPITPEAAGRLVAAHAHAQA